MVMMMDRLRVGQVVKGVKRVGGMGAGNGGGLRVQKKHVVASDAFRLGVSDFASGKAMPDFVQEHIEANGFVFGVVGLDKKYNKVKVNSVFSYERGRQFAAATGLKGFKLKRGGACPDHILEAYSGFVADGTIL